MKSVDGAPGAAPGIGSGNNPTTPPGAASGGRPGPGDDVIARQIVAFGSLPALEGETLEACVERHRRAVAAAPPSQHP